MSAEHAALRAHERSAPSSWMICRTTMIEVRGCSDRGRTPVRTPRISTSSSLHFESGQQERIERRQCQKGPLDTLEWLGIGQGG